MPQANVLVVEDDDSIRRLLIEVLKERSAVHVDGARDGVDALHMIMTRKYGVIILDVMMPHMTGIDFLDSLEVLLSDPFVKQLAAAPAVIVVTAAPQEQIPSVTIEERFPNLVRAVLRKPLDLDALTACVDALI